MPLSRTLPPITPKDPGVIIPMTEPAAPAAVDPEQTRPEMRQNSEQSPNDRIPERYIPPPRSPSSVRRIRMQNRRRRYLERHPSYFEGESDGRVNEESARSVGENHEMLGTVGMEAVDPLLYDRLVRRFQTAEERTAARRTKGFAATLSADLSRAEARLAAVSPNNSHSSSVSGQLINGDRDSRKGSVTDTVSIGVAAGMKPFLIEPDSPTTREEGLAQWRAVLTHRFVAGLDSDFDYTTVDTEDGKSSSVFGEDEEDEKERQERWFEEEEGDDDDEQDNQNKDENYDERVNGEHADENKSENTELRGKSKGKVILSGETGIQDF